MRRALRVHPEAERGPVTRLEVEIVRRQPAALDLTYELTGQIAELRIPPAAPPERSDGLWKQTCFEAFLRGAEQDGYLEFNLSPSGRWAAYRFTGYREGMAPALELPAPKIRLAVSERGLRLKARLDLAAAADFVAAGTWRLGLSAVIENAWGGVTHWALVHPPGKPDFHHTDGFACRLRAPEET